MKKSKSTSLRILMLLAPLLISGCGLTNDLTHKDPFYTPTPIVRVPPATGSIWPGASAQNMLFSDKKARYVDDLVTIVISESSTGQNKADSNTKRDSSLTGTIDTMLGLDGDAIQKLMGNPTDAVKAVIGLSPSILKSNANLGLGMKGAMVSELKGKGDTTRDGRLKASLTARVINVMDNGNLIIEGRRQVTVNAEDQYLVIAGIVRPEDITGDNQVQSKHIADARIFYTGMGVVNDKLRPGWLTRALDWAWPF